MRGGRTKPSGRYHHEKICRRDVKMTLGKNPFDRYHRV